MNGDAILNTLRAENAVEYPAVNTPEVFPYRVADESGSGSLSADPPGEDLPRLTLKLHFSETETEPQNR